MAKTKYYIGFIADEDRWEPFGSDCGKPNNELLAEAGYDEIHGPYDDYPTAQSRARVATGFKS